jgi:autotransporter-associated beta strand protein
MASSTILQMTNASINNSLSVTGAVQIQTLGPSLSAINDLAGTGSSISFSNNAGLFVFKGGMTNFSGSLSFGSTSGSYRFNTSTNMNAPCTGTTNATFDLGSGANALSNCIGGGVTYNLGGLAGGASSILAGRMSNSTSATTFTSIYSIGANGSNTTFNGKIADGNDGANTCTVSVTKVGSGTLTLNGASTFTGTLTVSNGTLGGNGSIAGPLSVTAGGTLSPGSSIGTFSVGGAATLAGTVLMELNQTNTPASNDLVSVTGTITASGGTLTVTNIGLNIRNGSTFKLFNKGVLGAFAVTNLPATNPNGSSPYVWANNIGVDGTITLVSGGLSLTPTNVTAHGSGSTLTLNWPTDHLGWQLISNSAGLAFPNSWFPLPGTENGTSAILSMDASKTNVFFRMTYPPR